jgi:starch-binding outer membrane protein, SusD/RagB family
MKRILYILPLLLALASCEKFLEVDPQLQVDDSKAITNEASAATALNGLYNQLASNNYYGSNFSALSYLSGGDIQWSGSQGAPQEVVLHKLTADNSYVSSAWTAIYRTILSANFIVVNVPAVTDPLFTEVKKNQVLGEAYFIRALAYFDLARGWGGVPIILSPTRTADENQNVPKSSLNDTYAQVLKDLEQAERLLPETTNRNKATKKTVWALRARYHLYRQEWDQAESYASKIISDTQNYSLLKPYSAFFANNAVGTAESVFELAYTVSSTNGHSNWWLPPALGGRREWSPNGQLVTLLSSPVTGGGRKDLLGQTAAPGNLWYGKLYYRTPRGTDPAYIIRTAELYLIRSEARAQQNKLSEALLDLNAVRDRAALSPFTSENRDEVLAAIGQERRLEFAFETDRWFELVRSGKVATTLGITDANKYVFPIPTSEIVANSAIIQNEGY